MPQPSLFPNWSWNLPLPEPFHGVTHKRRIDAASIYNDQPVGSQQATLHPCMLRAVQKYFALRKAYADPDGLGALGLQRDGKTVSCEYPSRDELQAVVYDSVSGKFHATRYCGYGKSAVQEMPYSLKEGECSLTALYFATLPIAMEDNEFLTELTDLQKMEEAGYSDMDLAIRCAAKLCDNWYRRLKRKDLGAEAIKTNLQGVSERLPLLVKKKLQQGEYCPRNCMAGSFHVLNTTSTGTTSIRLEDFAGKYPLTESRELTAAELRTVPVLGEWYVIPPEAECICRHAQATTDSAVPIRNILLRGPAGTGKTEAAKALAAGMRLPYRHITCSAGTAIEDLLGQLLPVTEDNSEQLSESLPTLEDVLMDPASAYCKLTGEYREVSMEEVYGELVTALRKSVGGDGGPRYTYVESPLVEALRNGYLVEIQEPSCIANPAVLVGLNSLLDNCKSLVLPTGAIVARHPDAVVVITTNLDYEGTRGMNQSVLSRMQLKVDMEEPDEATMTERAMKVSGCKEQKVIRKMVKVVRSMAEKCRAAMITDGSCGMRELISWAQSYMVLHDPVEAAKYTILPSATADQDAQAGLRSGCLDPIFSSS